MFMRVFAFGFHSTKEVSKDDVNVSQLLQDAIKRELGLKEPAVV